jgi:hypothetical protein
LRATTERQGIGSSDILAAAVVLFGLLHLDVASGKRGEALVVDLIEDLL